MVTMSSILTRKKLVFSFVLSACFGIGLVTQGLFIQEPISVFEEKTKSGLSPTLDLGFASTQWHPEWHRARVFYVEATVPVDVDLTTMLHDKWVFFPSLSFEDSNTDKLFVDAPKDSQVLLEFSESLYFQSPHTTSFHVTTEHPHIMYIDGSILPSGQEITLSKGLHSWKSRVLLQPNQKLSKVVTATKNNIQNPARKGEFTSYTMRLGDNRTSFRLPIEDVFVKGESILNENAISTLESLWFGVNEGRFLGRIVVEVHNKDGGISLSQNRAITMAKWLVEKGSPSKIITVQGYGNHWLSPDEGGRLDVLLLH